MRGGQRDGAGRPSGAKNKRTEPLAGRVEVTRTALSASIPNAFEGDAHALLMAVYMDPAHEWALRIDAAKAAIRYERPALSSISADVTQKNVPVRIDPSRLTDEQLDQLISMLEAHHDAGLVAQPEPR